VIEALEHLMNFDTLAATLQQQGVDISSLNRIVYGDDHWLASLGVPFADRSAAWLGLRDLFDQTGYWPVFVSGLPMLIDDSQHARAEKPSQILEQAQTLDPEAWLLDMDHLTDYPDAQWVIGEVLTALDQQHLGLGDDFVLYEELRAETESALTSDVLWTEKSTPPTIDEQLGLTYAAVPEDWKPAQLDLVLFQASHWWEIPALLNYYPADPGPSPAEHVSLLRRWSERYGAELVSLGSSDLALRATRPPQERTEAITLAWEHTLYCHDIYIFDVLQLAVRLYRGEGWGFWWD
jgi:hypothetical protein